MLYLYLVKNYRNLPLGFADRFVQPSPQPVQIVADVALLRSNRHPFTTVTFMT
jgi:hypothetical protein